MRIEDNVVRKRIRAGGGAATVTDDRRRLGIGGGDDAQEIHVTQTGVEGKGCRGGGRGGEGRRKEVDKGKEHRQSRFIFHHDGQIDRGIIYVSFVYIDICIYVRAREVSDAFEWVRYS